MHDYYANSLDWDFRFSWVRYNSRIWCVSSMTHLCRSQGRPAIIATKLLAQTSEIVVLYACKTSYYDQLKSSYYSPQNELVLWYMFY